MTDQTVGASVDIANADAADAPAAPGTGDASPEARPGPETDRDVAVGSEAAEPNMDASSESADAGADQQDQQPPGAQQQGKDGAEEGAAADEAAAPANQEEAAPAMPPPAPTEPQPEYQLMLFLERLPPGTAGCRYDGQTRPAAPAAGRARHASHG